MEEGPELVIGREGEELVDKDSMVEPTVGGALTECPGRTWRLTDRGRTRECVVSGRAERPTDQGDIHGPEAQGGTAGSRD